MTSASAGTLLNNRHEIICNLWKYGVTSLKHQEMLAELEKIEAEILDRLRSIGSPEYVSYQRHNKDQVIKIDYSDGWMEFVEILTSFSVDWSVHKEKQKASIEEIPEWVPDHDELPVSTNI